MKKLMWVLLGFVLTFAWGMSYAADRPEVIFLDDVASGTTTQAGTAAATGVSCIAVVKIDQGYEKMVFYPPTSVLFGKESPSSGLGSVLENADPGGTGLTGDSGATYVYAWRPLSSTEDPFNSSFTKSDVTPFYTSAGGAGFYTVGGVSDVPSANTDIPATERIAIFFVTACSQYQIPGTGEVVVK